MAHHEIDERSRRGALVLRTLPILLIPILVSAALAIVLAFAAGLAPRAGDGPLLFLPLVPIVVLVVFSSALIILVRLGRPTISALVLIGCWTFFTTLIWTRAGVNSYFPALLILPICAAGLLIDRVASISLGLLAMVLVGSAAWLQSQGVLPPAQAGALPPGALPAPPPFPLTAGQSLLLAVVFWAGLFFSVAALTSLLAGGLQRALQQSRSQAAELRQLSEELEARVAAQTAQILDGERETATLAERTRLAREIHDTIAQGLSGVALQLGAAQRALDIVPGEAREHLDLAARMTREVLAEARRSVWNLRSPALDHGDIGDALEGLAERQSRPDYRVTFEQVGAPRPLPAQVEGALLRLAQEALSNAMRHAGASAVALTLEYTSGGVRLTVRDDGVGFGEALLREAPAGPGSGFGLAGMRERLVALGGTLSLRDEGGAVVTATIPDARGGDDTGVDR